MRFIMHAILLSGMMLCIGTSNVSGRIYEAKDVKIQRGHPILFVDQKLVASIREKKSVLAGYRKYVKIAYEKNTANSNDIPTIAAEVESMVSYNHTLSFIDAAMAYGINAYINNDTLSKEYAKQYIIAMLKRPLMDTGKDDQIVRGRLMAFALLYDWNYDYLSVSLSQEVRIRIIDLISFMDSTWNFISKPTASGAHDRTGNIAALAGLLAIRNEIDQDSELLKTKYYAFLQRVIDNWTMVYNPAQIWLSKAGGTQMGWAYGASYTSMYPYIMWHFASDQKSWFENWQNEMVYFFLYGYQGDRFGNVFPYFGDVTATAYSPFTSSLHLLVPAYFFNNRYAQWYYNFFGDQSYSYWDILYNTFKSTDGQSPDSLPKARLFENSGFVLMRDSWDFTKNTLLVFKSSSFYSLGHQHKDQNSFTIYYKSPLAIDAGAYDAAGSYGSVHWWNYYTRSIAHNTILVYDPSESFIADGKKYSNDGGQAFFSPSSPNLQQMQEGGSNHFKGIVAFENSKDYTYSSGDASTAYKSSKVSLFLRSVVYLRDHSYNHPAIVIYDKVVSPDPTLKKTYLLHSIQKPIIAENMVMIHGDSMNSTLFQQTVLPQHPLLSAIGGRENNQDFFVQDDGTGKPHNYNENVNYSSTVPLLKTMIHEAGQWRVEISAKTPSAEETFLHTLSITDGTNQNVPVKVEYIISQQKLFEGVGIRNNDTSKQKSTVVLFLTSDFFKHDSISIDSKKYQKMLLLGLAPKKNYRISISEGKKWFIISEASIRDTIVNTSSNQGTLYMDLFNMGTPTKDFLDNSNKGPFYKNHQQGSYLYRLSKPGFVAITVYDCKGQSVCRFFSALQEAGVHSFDFNKNQTNRINRGVYLFTIHTEEFTRIDKIISY